MKSMIRSMPPVSRRLPSSSARLVANGLPALPSDCSRVSSGSVAASAGAVSFEVAPRFLKNFIELVENDGMCVKVLLIPLAACFSSVATGVV